ncbi:MAG: hypothetical protein K2P81_12190 [Bacteriovoracaceae bacterium]|nr:hypothetical protein [Bacteriovoracaceae bacterium]
MKFVLLTLLLSLVGCMQDMYGYKDNPMSVLINSQFAVQSKNLEDLSNNFGRGALCLWGTQENMEVLKKEMPGMGNLDPQISLTDSQYFKAARFVGYWAYYLETYHVQILNKITRELVAEAKIECNFGETGVKKDSDINKPKKQYSEKHCKVVIFEGRTFKNPIAKKECAVFNDTL